jgi:hypothetical protein
MVDSLKALDPKWPIREADINQAGGYVSLVPATDSRAATIGASLDHLVCMRQQIGAFRRFPACARTDLAQTVIRLLLPNEKLLLLLPSFHADPTLII